MALQNTTSHALVLSFPSQGHVNPLLLISAHLALQGCTITFVHFQHSSQPTLVQSRIESAILSPIQDKNLPIHFVTIPDGFPEDLELANADHDDLEHLINVLEGLSKQQGMVEALIQSSKSTTSPISCIISDCFLYWTSNMGRKLAIPIVLFWSAAATAWHTSLLLAMLKDRLPDGMQNTSKAPLHPEVLSQQSNVLASLSQPPSSALFQLVMLITGDIHGNACVLVNSFLELEGSILEAMVHEVPIKFVGPLLPLPPLADQRGLTEINVGGGLCREESECLQWLDKQTHSSVVYIAFGSLASLSPADLIHLALGIEASKKPFLWVIADDNGENTPLLPEGFKERTHHRGVMISWAPQRRVLSHPAVGAFLTHCGWNSTVESIAMGVPLLCCPVFGDQHLNSTLIVTQWKVGFQMNRRKEGGLLEKEEVERVVRMAMEDGEASREVRRRVGALKEAAVGRAAAMGGTSSSSAMAALLHHTLNSR